MQGKLQLLAYRILFCYFVQGKQAADNGEVTYPTFAMLMQKQPNAEELTIETALQAIQLDKQQALAAVHQQQNTIMIYLGIDEYQLLSQPILKELAYALGIVMCRSNSYFLIPFFTGTDFSGFYEAIQGSTFRAHPLKFLLPNKPQVNELMDELAVNYAVLKHWRLWSAFRRALEDFQGYMRGIEKFIWHITTTEIPNCDKLPLHEFLTLVQQRIHVNEIFATVRRAISKEYLNSITLSFAPVLANVFIHKAVHRNDVALGNNWTYEKLEETGVLALQQVENNDYVTIKLPYIFLTAFMSRMDMRTATWELFQECKWWQEWEQFNHHYEVLIENMLCKSLRSSMKVSEYYKGALFSKRTGDVLIPLSNDVIAVTSCGQFPTNNARFPTQLDYSSRRMWAHDTVVMNAPAAPFADIFKFRPGIIVAIQCMSGSGNELLLEDVLHEHAKNQRVVALVKKQADYQKLEKNMQSNCQLLTVVKTSKRISAATEQAIQQYDNIIVVSKNQFRDYYGDIFADRAWFASCMYIVLPI